MVEITYYGDKSELLDEIDTEMWKTKINEFTGTQKHLIKIVVFGKGDFNPRTMSARELIEFYQPTILSNEWW